MTKSKEQSTSKEIYRKDKSGQFLLIPNGADYELEGKAKTRLCNFDDGDMYLTSQIWIVCNKTGEKKQFARSTLSTMVKKRENDLGYFLSTYVSSAGKEKQTDKEREERLKRNDLQRKERKQPEASRKDYKKHVISQYQQAYAEGNKDLMERMAANYQRLWNGDILEVVKVKA